MRNSFDPSALIRLRKAAKLTQAQLAERVSVATWTVGSWELGRQTPEAKHLPGLAAALDVEVDELLGTAPPTPRVFRHRLGLTQVELAELMGIASGVVAEVELGLYVPSASDQWADALGVEPAVFVAACHEQQRLNDERGK